MEELGIDAKIGKLVFIQEFIREGSTIIDFWYAIENPQDFYNINLSKITH